MEHRARKVARALLRRRLVGLRRFLLAEVARRADRPAAEGLPAAGGVVRIRLGRVVLERRPDVWAADEERQDRVHGPRRRDERLEDRHAPDGALGTEPPQRRAGRQDLELEGRAVAAAGQSAAQRASAADAGGRARRRTRRPLLSYAVPPPGVSETALHFFDADHLSVGSMSYGSQSLTLPKINVPARANAL